MRSTLRIIIGIVVVLCLAAAGLAWLGSSQWALQQTASAVARLSQGHIEIQGARGSLYGPFHIDALTVNTNTQSLAFRQIDLDWRPAALLRNKLSIAHLDIDSLTAGQLQASGKPASPPNTLHLPFDVGIDAATLGKLNIERGGNRITLEHLAASAHTSAGGDYRLELKSLDSPWGSAQGTLNLGATQPFSLDATLSAWQHDRIRIEAQAKGSLEEFDLSAHGVRGIAFQLAARLAPFAPLPIEQMELRAQHIDPARLQPGLPNAAIDAQARFSRSSSRQINGSLHLANAAPGPLDHKQIPVAMFNAQFNGPIDNLLFSELVIDLNKGGRLAGSGTLHHGTLDARLTTSNLDPHSIHSRIRPLALAGQIHLNANSVEQSLQANLGHSGYRLDADLDQRAGMLHIRNASLSAGQGKLDFNGQVVLSGSHAFDLQGKLARFNPAAFGSYATADLNAQIQASGMFSPLSGSLHFDLSSSRYRGHPVVGKGRLAISPSHVLDSDVTLAIGNNRFLAKGRFGAPGDRMKIEIAGSELGEIDPRLSGHVNASGELMGSLNQPAGTLKIDAGKLRWDTTFAFDRLQLSGQLAHGLAGPVDLTATLQGLTYDKRKLDEARLDIHGKRSAHQISLAVRNSQIDLDAQLSGALSGSSWAGKLDQLENRGRYAFSLQAPATLALGRQYQQLDNADFRFLGGRIQLVSFTHRNHVIASDGRITGMPIVPLFDLLQINPVFDGDLQLSGNWTIRTNGNPQIHINLFRERGDLIARTEPGLPLGLNQLMLLLQLKDGQLKVDAAAVGSQFGRARFSAETHVTQHDGKWGLAAGTPVSGSGQFNLPSLAWLSPLVDRTGGLKLAGALRAQASLSGTVAQPELSGEIRGKQLALNWPGAGLHLSNGQLNATLDKNALILDNFDIHGPSGEFNAQGSARLAGGKIQVDINGKADKLEILSRPDLKLTISGSSKLALDKARLLLQGDIKADRARIILPAREGVTHSSDVVVIGRSTQESATIPTRIQIDTQLDLGNDFSLSGRGLNAQLTGKLNVRATSISHPQVFGTVKVASGTYEAYGQKLTIERGILDFRGRLDNPVLDIIAMRKNQDVEAGVSLSGTALAPKAKLVSNPEVPDSDKLSWLVLGHSMDTASGTDYGLLTAAAGALLSSNQSASLQTRIAHAAGLDEISVKNNTNTTTGLETTVLSLGKRLSKRAYVSYEQGLGGISYLLKLNYTLSRRLTVQAQTGQESAIDLLYTFTFN